MSTEAAPAPAPGTWGQFERAAPDLAAAGRRLLDRDGSPEALLATVRGGLPPRIHPVAIGFVGDGLYAFILPGPKLTDLEQDGRYALHSHQDPRAPSEFAIRGRARPVDDADEWAAAAASWSFATDDRYGLFEFCIGNALLGLREGADEWPPRYSSWSVGDPLSQGINGPPRASAAPAPDGSGRARR